MLLRTSCWVQIMVLLTSALRAERPAELRLQALEGWSVLIKALIVAAPLQCAGILSQVSSSKPRYTSVRCIICSIQSHTGTLVHLPSDLTVPRWLCAEPANTGHFTRQHPRLPCMAVAHMVSVSPTRGVQ